MRRLRERGISAILVTSTLVLATVSLFLEQITPQPPWLFALVHLVDFVVIGITLTEVTIAFRRAPVKRNYLRFNWPSLAFLSLFIVLFTYNKAIVFLTVDMPPGGYQTVLIIRNLFLLLKVFTRLRRLSEFVTTVVTHPAQTVTMSFLLVIAVGTLLLMMPLATLDGEGLPLVDALFTATSAVCVTGLIVVDTATVYTMWGQLIILMLIQIGGLGIMVLSLFAVVLMRQSVSVESHLLLSYMLSESRITDLAASLKRIVLITFGVEAAGAILLFLFFGSLDGVADGTPQRLLMAVFHAVSAFCNAGFALFTTSLEQFHDHLGINLVIAALIIAGGLSFAVLTNLYQWFRFDLVKRRRGRDTRYVPLTVNTRAVTAVTAALLLIGFLGFYALEMGNSLARYPAASQYLAAFFQSVTLRTAGFNTIPMGELATATYILMMTLMFIGGASGSTAGGLKVNNLAVIMAFLDGRRRNRAETVLFGHAVSDRQTATAFSVLLFGILSVIGGTFLLALTESASLVEYLFETVSAFATVGLSTGLTPTLSVPGRLVVTVLMFIGRVGPLTLLAASSGPPRRTQIRYPSAVISTG